MRRGGRRDVHLLDIRPHVDFCRMDEILMPLAVDAAKGRKP